MEIVARYFPGLTDTQTRQIQKLEGLYLEWNQKINVVSRKDIQNLYLHHVLHSMSIAKIIQFAHGTSVMDVGTGGGFPGIPLAILFPGASFYLIDSIAKKIKVANEICIKLGLGNVCTEQRRAEDVKKKVDFVVSRAVTTLPKFVAMVKNNISGNCKNQLKNGILYLKGGDLAAETRQIKPKTAIYPLASLFEEEYFKTKAIVHVDLTGN